MQLTSRSGSKNAGMLVLLLALAGCSTDPCQTYAIAVNGCPEFVDINSTSSSTGSGTPTTTCNDKQENVAQCLLNTGVDPCKIVYHPDTLSQAEQQKVAACKAGL